MPFSTIVFGIVGGIGSGKSFATAAFRALGALSFDADAEARRLFDDAAILETLRRRWGAAVVRPNGEVDRRKLAEIVFAPNELGRQELEFLNATTRPPLFARFQRWLEAARAARQEFAVLDAPLLFEGGWERNVDYVVFVDASLATRARRVAQRGWKCDELERREARQIPLELKKSRADFVLDADVDNSRMYAQVERVLAETRRRQETNAPN